MSCRPSLLYDSCTMAHFVGHHCPEMRRHRVVRLVCSFWWGLALSAVSLLLATEVVRFSREKLKGGISPAPAHFWALGCRGGRRVGCRVFSFGLHANAHTVDLSHGRSCL